MHSAKGYLELATIVRAWPYLASPVRTAILGMVQVLVEQTKQSARK
jgi:hypothetical protein